jgi:XTP/dITP diphosphohydrolase
MIGSVQLVLASNNQGKINEIKALLTGVQVLTQSVLGIEACPEPACTFVENALLKARHAALHAQLPAIADDSGLMVDALKGAPGVRSARFSGEAATDADNIQHLLTLMQAVPESQRMARFICVMVYVEHAEDPCPLIAQGVWEGSITTQTRGVQGFGYDPIFWVPAQHCTAAELAPDIKNTLSHRAQALHHLSALIMAKPARLTCPA